MFLSALTVKKIVVNMDLAGSAGSLEQRFQRDVNYLFVAAGAQQRYPVRATRAPAAARSPPRKGRVSAASCSGAI